MIEPVASGYWPAFSRLQKRCWLRPFCSEEVISQIVSDTGDSKAPREMQWSGKKAGLNSSNTDSSFPIMATISRGEGEGRSGANSGGGCDRQDTIQGVTVVGERDFVVSNVIILCPVKQHRFVYIPFFY